MKRFVVFVIVLAAIGLAAYATLISHAERPCLVTKANPCTRYLNPGGT